MGIRATDLIVAIQTGRRVIDNDEDVEIWGEDRSEKTNISDFRPACQRVIIKVQSKDRVSRVGGRGRVLVELVEELVGTIKCLDYVNQRQGQPHRTARKGGREAWGEIII